jgi:hypothetical protein
MTPPSQERRGFKRVTYPCEARGYGVGESLFKASISDLSVDGAFVHTTTELPPGTIVLLRFEAAGARLKLEGEVIHCQRGSGLGVRFVSLTETQRAAIESIGRSE